jgi:hypothetical protein
MFSVFYGDAPVTDYSPAVFDAFVNQTKVSPSFGLLHLALRPKYEYIISSGGRVFGLWTKT